MRNKGKDISSTRSEADFDLTPEFTLEELFEDLSNELASLQECPYTQKEGWFTIQDFANAPVHPGERSIHPETARKQLNRLVGMGKLVLEKWHCVNYYKKIK